MVLLLVYGVSDTTTSIVLSTGFSAEFQNTAMAKEGDTL